MGARTSGRQAAAQMLYALDLGGREPEEVIQGFWRELPAEAEGRPYADEAVRGAWEMREEADRLISEASNNWRLDRMARVDRNILRLGVWELRARPDVPAEVVLDEAVELAKRFGGENSRAFVNGVLNRIASGAARLR